ncbi:MAG TPA: RluA family pseudouridine synthase [Terriglobales bacterium]|nr:RluA family pseudouridine synthase [Terriglobales bacterium]
MPGHGPTSTFEVAPEQAGRRLDQFLVTRLPELSRARVQQLIGDGKVLVNDSAAKPSLKLKGGERIQVLGPATPRPLRAIPEEIPLDVVYEDDDLAVINKPAGMMVHAGAGATEDERNRGTLVNALLHRFGQLSGVGGELRPGIVHRLDRATSGLIVVAKNDFAHGRLAKQFSGRQVRKRYIALVHGRVRQETGTISSAISRDRIRRTRMTTRRSGGREAVTHYNVRERIDSGFGKFSLLDLKIDTGRTHQIRVHLASLGHPVVGDTLYGAPRELRPRTSKSPETQPLSLARNFLHAAALEFAHPQTGNALSFSCPLPAGLLDFLGRVRRASGYNGELG